MVNKLSAKWSILLIPLMLGWAVSSTAYPQDAGGFRVTLLDGSLVNGAVSLVINLDTPYGQIKIPSNNLVSAQFDVQQKWAEIQLSDAQMKLRYTPASSDVKATTSAGTLTIALSNVIKIARGSAEVSNATSPNAAANQNNAAGQPGVPPTAYAQQPPPAAYQNPYPYSYQYAPSAPYYDYSYYGAPYYWPYYGYGWGWPYIGFGWGWGGYGRGFGGFHGGGFHGGGRR